MTDVEVRFEDADGDGDREVVVLTPICGPCCGSRNSREWGSTGAASPGGRLQSLIYKPTAREHFMPEMLDPEDVRPFGLPDELFASFPMESADGRQRRLKMGVGVGVITEGEGAAVLEPLPWSWRQEKRDAETGVAWWVPAAACPGAIVTLRFTDAESHPAVALRAAGRGRVAAVASRPAWGKTGRTVIWDGWGQYHRACFGGLTGWVARAW